MAKQKPLSERRPNLGVTVNGNPLDPGSDLYDPSFWGPSCPDPRYAERWRPSRKAPTRGTIQEGKMKRGTTITKTGKVRALPVEEVRRRGMFGY